MSIHNHVWGVSLAADRVWSQVSGVRPSLAGRRLIMVMQAFIDESFDDDWFVLGGFVSTAERWAEFAKEWEQLLPRFGTLGPNGYHFKMAEMASIKERRERIPAFLRLIEKHTIAGLTCSLRLSDMEKAKARLHPVYKDVALPKYFQPFTLSLYGLLGTLAGNAEMLNGLLELPIDFYFDENSEKTQIISAWGKYLGAEDSSVRLLTHNTPKFEHDHVFLPLQAADALAWMARKRLADGSWVKMHPQNSDDPQIIKSVDVELTEDNLFQYLMQGMPQVTAVPVGVISWQKKGE